VLLFALTSLNRIVRSANLDGRRLDAQNCIVFFATIWLTTNGDFKIFIFRLGVLFGAAMDGSSSDFAASKLPCHFIRK
jgi:hypothetical protein